MIKTNDYVRQSLELHLFFMRIMKEHSFFLEVGFTPRDVKYSERADFYRTELDNLLREVVQVANGVVRSAVLESWEVVTPYTLEAENLSSIYTGIEIPTDITIAEQNLMSQSIMPLSPNLEQVVFDLNQRTIKIVTGLINFKNDILKNVLAGNMFTVNYPLLIDHIMREAKLYVNMLRRLQRGEVFNPEVEALNQEQFWNRIMAEHAKFIRGLLDPTEEELFEIANNFGNTFDQLTEEAKQALDNIVSFGQVTVDSLQETVKIRDFKIQGTEGLLQHKIKSIILPLLGDHVVREASHFLRLLETYKQQSA